MIECCKLTKRYGKTLALNGLDLSIGDGEVHGFVGPNGAGKTTAMKILATIMRPSCGDARIDGVSVCDQPDKARRLVGYMPDFFGVYDNLKAWEYLDFYAGCMGFGAKARRRRLDELLELTALSDKREAYVDGLSRGMKQRLCLARALLHDPSLLILDEPASGMDPKARAQMREVLQSVRSLGKTVLISSHILPELAQICSRVTVLEKGKCAFSGSIEALENRVKHTDELTLCLTMPIDEDMKARMQAEILGIHGVQALETSDTRWSIPCRQTPEKDAKLLAVLIGLGAPIRDYHRERATLETVLLEVMEHENESDF